MSEVNLYSMSDDELLNYTPETNTEETDEQLEENQVTDSETNDDTSNDNQAPVNVSDDVESDEHVVETDANQDTERESTESTDVANDVDNQTVSDVDYKAFYDKLTQSFKADGREITVTNPDDIIALMQRGVNYSNNQAKLKPKLGLLKALEKHGLDDAQKLSHLIELSQGNPDAIAKLIKEHDVDIYAVDIDSADDYVPKNYIQDSGILEDTLANLQANSPHYDKLLGHIGSVWDEDSKKLLFNQPALLTILDSQIASGMFDKITNIIDYERMLGRMHDVSYIQAYQMVEQSLLGNAQQQPNTPQGFTATRPNQTQATNNAVQKRKVASPKTTTSTATVNENVYALSDEEIMKRFSQI